MIDRPLDAGLRYDNPGRPAAHLTGEIIGRLRRQPGEPAKVAKTRAQKMGWWSSELRFDTRSRAFWVWRKPVMS